MDRHQRCRTGVTGPLRLSEERHGELNIALRVGPVRLHILASKTSKSRDGSSPAMSDRRDGAIKVKRGAARGTGYRPPRWSSTPPYTGVQDLYCITPKQDSSRGTGRNRGDVGVSFAFQAR